MSAMPPPIHSDIRIRWSRPIGDQEGYWYAERPVNLNDPIAYEQAKIRRLVWTDIGEWYPWRPKRFTSKQEAMDELAGQI